MTAYRSSVGMHTLGHPAWQALTKVPKITIYFWVIKILTTAMGEATSDYLAHRFNPFLAGGIGFFAFAVALWLQFRAKRYIAWVYWLAAAMVAVFGTMAADGLHVELGVPYIASSIFYAVLLIIVFVWWYASEKTLSIHSVYTKKREVFYWAAVLSTFALGTAAGDLTAYTMHLGYLTSGILFAGIFAVPAIAYWLFKLNPIVAFWFAYIITRPLGACFADWIGVPKELGGLNVGRGVVSLSLTVLIVLLVGYVSLTRVDSQSKHDL